MIALFDENMSYDLAWALHRLGKYVRHVRDIPELGKGATDQQIFEYSGPRTVCVVTRDEKAKRTPEYVADIRRLAVGMFLVYTGSARQLRAWPIVKLVIKAWEEMEAFADANKPPFIALIKSNGRVVKFH